LPNGTVGTAYTALLTSSGGTNPVWSISTGQLPSGLSLDSASGMISGMPSTAGSYAFTAQATDPSAGTATQAYTVVISSAPSASGGITITNADLPNGTVGAAYAATMAASGGTAPYTWSISNGSLPAGLTLSADGAITGTSTSRGWSNLLSIQVTD